MGLLDAFRRILGKTGDGTPAIPAARSAAPEEPEEVHVPEVTAQELMAELKDSAPPLILDCREPYEWRTARIPGSLHIPMNSIPRRLQELDPSAQIAVICAHGNRSYGVAGYLLQNGYKARSVRGGLAAWQAQGGQVESDLTRR